MTDDPLYHERISSQKTEALFVGLAILFFVPFAWLESAQRFGGWSILCFCLFAFFLFYALNYKTLILQMDRSNLRLRFGLFQWAIPLPNIESCFLDMTSLRRIGGAGIHFTFVDGRYRAMFNFLEYSRVVIRLKINKGPIREIAFSTQHPEEVIRLINEYGKTEPAA
jgi:hypothetical protein